MHLAGRVPMSAVVEKDAGADQVVNARSCVLQHLGEDLEDDSGLRRGISNRDGFAARARGRAADGDDIADAHGAGEADNRLVRAPGRHKKSLGRDVVHAALLHQSLGLARGPAASSITRAVRSKVSSSNGLPISCNPSGVPSDDRPAGTLMPGSPAMLTVTVKMSFRYISTGSPPDFSPTPKAEDGVAGVRTASTPASKANSKSRLISVRTFWART